MRALLPRLARKAGIEKRVHAHDLRHTHAFELACEGHPLHVIQAQLGHTSLATTDRYVQGVRLVSSRRSTKVHRRIPRASGLFSLIPEGTLRSVAITGVEVHGPLGAANVAACTSNLELGAFFLPGAIPNPCVGGDWIGAAGFQVE